MSGRTSYNQSSHEGGYERIMSRQNSGMQPAPPLSPPPSYRQSMNRFSTIILPSASPSSSSPTWQSSSSPAGHATQHPGGQAIGNPWPAYSYGDRVGHFLPFRRIPTSTLSNVEVFELNNDLARRAYPRTRLPPSLSLRHEGFPRNNPAPVEPSEESRFTLVEQDKAMSKAMSKLRKETYNPLLKRSTSSGSNYQARDWAILSRQTELEDDNEHGKRCSVCLEDFRIKEVVTLMPCNHMFHDDCIVPWVKSHGSCPVCRCAIIEPGRERREATAMPAAVSNPTDNHAATPVRGSLMYEIRGYGLGPRNSLTFVSGNINDGLFEREFASVVRAMEAAVGWDVVRPSLN